MMDDHRINQHPSLDTRLLSPVKPQVLRILRRPPMPAHAPNYLEGTSILAKWKDRVIATRHIRKEIVLKEKG